MNQKRKMTVHVLAECVIAPILNGEYCPYKLTYLNEKGEEQVQRVSPSALNFSVVGENSLLFTLLNNANEDNGELSVLEENIVFIEPIE